MFCNPFYEERHSINSNEKQKSKQSRSEDGNDKELLDNLSDESNNLSHNEIGQIKTFSNPLVDKDNYVRVDKISLVNFYLVFRRPFRKKRE